ncbi:hypothetical protein [Flavobacterium alkalisoli]|uniref:hypothetical protein n=1 Tax=Flavobacterium alkalisoli TaxID=2602769 RepID=UPI003A911875
MKKLLIILSILLTFSILTIYLFIFSNIVFPWQKDEAIKTTLEWSGLTELPVDNEEIKVSKKGSMFTRQYILEFSARKSEIENWIEKSEKLKKIPAKEIGKTEIYNIDGEKGTMGGILKIKDTLVTLNISWS